jgi:hypothetical protein
MWYKGYIYCQLLYREDGGYVVSEVRRLSDSIV